MPARRHPYDASCDFRSRPARRPRMPAPPKRPLPLPRTEGLMPMACDGCIFEKCCAQSQSYGGHGQRYCALVPDSRNVRFADQVLLRLVGEWRECQADWDRLEAIAEDPNSIAQEVAAEAALQALWRDRWQAIERKIIATPARRSEGARAKAALVKDYDGDPPAALLNSIARDRQAGLLP